MGVVVVAAVAVVVVAHDILTKVGEGWTFEDFVDSVTDKDDAESPPEGSGELVVEVEDVFGHDPSTEWGRSGIRAFLVGEEELRADELIAQRQLAKSINAEEKTVFTEIEEENAAMNACATGINNCLDTIERMEGEIEVLEKELASVEKQIQAAENGIATTGNDIEKISTEIAVLKEQNTILEDRINDGGASETYKNEMKENMRSNNVRISDLEQRLTTVESRLRIQETGLKGLEEQRTEILEAIDGKNFEIVQESQIAAELAADYQEASNRRKVAIAELKSDALPKEEERGS